MPSRFKSPKAIASMRPQFFRSMSSINPAWNLRQRQRKFQLSIRNIFGKNTWPAVPDSMKNAIRQTLFPFYFRASLVAKQNQGRYRRAGTYGYLLPSFAVVAVALGALIPEMARWAFPFELAILAVALTIVGTAHRQRSAEKWVESRFLTERLRAAIYMAGCGVEVATIA